MKNLLPILLFLFSCNTIKNYQQGTLIKETRIINGWKLTFKTDSGNIERKVYRNIYVIGKNYLIQ